MILDFPSVISDVSKKLQRMCDTTYREKSPHLEMAIMDAVQYSWKCARNTKLTCDENHDDDDDEPYDSFDDDDMYAKKRGPEYPDCVDEITSNYDTIVEFLVFIQSIPPIDMGLRNKKLYNVRSGACFCPFGKKVGNFHEDFKTQHGGKFCILLDKKCKKDKFGTYQALIAHCDGTGDWYHEMYATFLRSFYDLDSKPKKRNEN